MSDDQRDQSPAEPAPAEAAAPAGPEPEPIPFFGTTWVNHDGGYALRRAGIAIGALVTAVAAALLLRLSYEGLELGNVGPFLSISVVVLFAISSSIAFAKTWESFSRRPAPSSDEAALKGLKAIGFIGSLIAYFLRCLVEAPGEKLRRAEYESAVAEFARRRSTRTGNPAARRPKRKK
ncbi:hypothetical protein OG765_19970 [Streptomyces sp. NBC_00555]|uniref:hypothetical protein n=1 Tax=Streptomyces sp. NBC_00555 TaxID=2903662 RepID=UPI0022548AC9|nr:hypothetical protein [Streptomyces sp. NBC_00555]MCX5013249.1 hypothetical protein [Streptomyces sp. NBC_00555]